MTKQVARWIACILFLSGTFLSAQNETKQPAAPSTPKPAAQPAPASPTAPVPASSVASSVDRTTPLPGIVSPGDKITIKGSFPPKNDEQPIVKIFEEGSKDPIDPKDTQRKDDKTIEVTLPDKLQAGGRYVLRVTYDNLKDELVPGELRIGSTVTVDSAHPTTAYRDTDNGGFDFDVVGQGFSPNATLDHILITGQGDLDPLGGNSRDDCNEKLRAQDPKNKAKACVWYEPPDKLHVVGYQKEEYQGPLKFRVKVGVSDLTSAEKPLVLARVSPAGLRFLSVVLFAIIAAIVLRLVSGGVQEYMIDGKPYSTLASFFLDKETDTYSLSKFQLLVLSTVFVFGYLYVFLCGWLVQWHFILPDVPANFSGILGISAGTTIAAAGATSARGSKGAGGIRPSVADFITTGGQVVPERFQFFVWTLVASFGFVVLLLSQDPATVTGFPDFPQGLLYIMGVSSAGYLGGKLTRAPGPVIRNIALDTPAPPAPGAPAPPAPSAPAPPAPDTPAPPTLIVQGENLSNEGDYFIDGVKLPIDPKATTSLISSTPQQQASDRGFCSELRIPIGPVAGLNLDVGDHVFKISNKDAQFAEIRFTADKPAIDSVFPTATQPEPAPGTKSLSSGDAEIGVTIKGSGFRHDNTVQWTPMGATVPTSIRAIFVDTTKLTLKLQPGKVGNAVLTVSNQNGSAQATIEITRA